MPLQTDQQAHPPAGFVTTLNAIRAHAPCVEGWQRLLTYLGKTKPDDEPLSLLTILDSNGIADALWCMQAVDGIDAFARHVAVDFAERARDKINGDDSIAALELSRAADRGDACEAAWESARVAARVAAKTAAYAEAGEPAKAAAWKQAAASERAWQTEHLRAALTNPAKYLASKSEVSA